MERNWATRARAALISPFSQIFSVEFQFNPLRGGTNLTTPGAKTPAGVHDPMASAKRWVGVVQWRLLLASSPHMKASKLGPPHCQKPPHTACSSTATHPFAFAGHFVTIFILEVFTTFPRSNLVQQKWVKTGQNSSPLNILPDTWLIQHLYHYEKITPNHQLLIFIRAIFQQKKAGVSLGRGRKSKLGNSQGNLPQY